MNTSWTLDCAPRSGGSEAPRRAANVHHTQSSARARKAGATRRRRRSLFQRRRTRSAHQPSRAQPAVGQRTTQHQPLLERCTDTVSGRGQGARVLGRMSEWWRWSVAPLFMTFWKDIHGVVPLLATRDSTHIYAASAPAGTSRAVATWLQPVAGSGLPTSSSQGGVYSLPPPEHAGTQHLPPCHVQRARKDLQVLATPIWHAA